MSNIMSAELTEWAELASTVESPVASNLASLLRSLSELTDSQLAAAKIAVNITVWNSVENNYQDALYLPEGCLIVGFFQQKVDKTLLYEAVKSVKTACVGFLAKTQAEILVKAQENGCISSRPTYFTGKYM